jgi:hypothetical protein
VSLVDLRHGFRDEDQRHLAQGIVMMRLADDRDQEECRAAYERHRLDFLNRRGGAVYRRPVVVEATTRGPWYLSARMLHGWMGG